MYFRHSESPSFTRSKWTFTSSIPTSRWTTELSDPADHGMSQTTISALSLEKRLWCLDETEVDYFRQGMKDYVKALEEKGQKVPEGITISEYDAMERKGDLGAQRLREEMAANLDALCKNAPMKVSSWKIKPIEAPEYFADQVFDKR